MIETLTVDGIEIETAFLAALAADLETALLEGLLSAPFFVTDSFAN